MKRTILIAVLLLSPTAQAEVFKCAVDGKTIYQDKPCAGSTREASRANLPPITSMSSPYSGMETSPAAKSEAGAPTANVPAAQMQPAPPTANEIRSAVIGNRVLQGMKASEVTAAAGKYRDHRVTSGADAQGNYEIWTFPQKIEGFPYSVKLRDGIVTEYSSDDLRTLHR